MSALGSKGALADLNRGVNPKPITAKGQWVGGVWVDPVNPAPDLRSKLGIATDERTYPPADTPPGEEGITQPASPAMLEASRAALAAALGGPLGREMIEGKVVSVFDGGDLDSMEVRRKNLGVTSSLSMT